MWRLVHDLEEGLSQPRSGLGDSVYRRVAEGKSKKVITGLALLMEEVLPLGEDEALLGCRPRDFAGQGAHALHPKKEASLGLREAHVRPAVLGKCVEQSPALLSVDGPHGGDVLFQLAVGDILGERPVE